MENKQIFVFKNNKLFGYIENNEFFKYINNGIEKSDKELYKILDLIPEGIDYNIMVRSFNIKNDIELLPYLKNSIGAYSFSDNINYIFQKRYLSDLSINNFTFPNILKLKLKIDNSELFPAENQNIAYTNKQNFSISGYQHKLQVYTRNNEIISDYGDFILKPDSIDYFDIPLNEHLNTTFMKEFGFEVPFNGLIFDEKNKVYHYLIKRFDIVDENTKKDQYSINALMKQKSKEKYNGSIENICKYISKVGASFEKEEKIKFLKYVFANVLLFNADMHKKNISFFYENGKFILTPSYDILNIFAIKANLGKHQTALTIDGKTKNINFSHFLNCIKILELDKNEVFNEFEKMSEIYFSKYPIYLKKLENSEIMNNIKFPRIFLSKSLETYNKNLSNLKYDKIFLKDNDLKENETSNNSKELEKTESKKHRKMR